MKETTDKTMQNQSETMQKTTEKWRKDLRSLPQLYKASKGDILAIESFISSRIDKAKEFSIREMIELSDEIEGKYGTEFNEWRAFKGFRNKMREQL